ncbi:hypothetical protein [Pseudonocardia acidicola]|uniref:Uncharacterized protein n=1 Tax=Pseudonocardia acidicola TaxID=2724939 RepID=A0ABX1SHS8_9PSEU|nr:hypothetical protein [Pseudonocardia acidicola]NMI00621.1 hypothetical protein [Pseudonocardia acidicola]
MTSGYPQLPADPDRISVADMAELTQAGEAIQLFPEFNIGPTFWDGAWWVVPQGPGEGARGYTMAPPELSQELTEWLVALQASAEKVATIQAARRAAKAAGREFVDGDLLGLEDPPGHRPAGARPSHRRRWWKR